MSNDGNCERFEKKPATDSGNEADDLESVIHTSSIRVKYYSSFEYCLKWEIPMYSRRSSRLPKASKKSPQRSPSPNEEVIQRRLRSNRQKTGLRKTKAGDSVVNTDEGTNPDIIDIINSTHDDNHVAEEHGGKFVEVADEGVDESDEDCYSVTSSIASGPSLPLTTPKKLPSLGMCSACRKLYQKAKKMKTPIENKLLDNDPKSLTCDHWVLIKTWRPRRLPNARGKLLTHVHLVKKRLVKNGAKQTEQCVGERESSGCSRPHIFLQRNLRRQSVRVPVKMGRKNTRKRTRDDSQSPRNAKQQRLHSNSHRQHTSIGCTDNSGLHPTSGHSRSPGFKDNEADTDLTVELLPSAVTLDITKPRVVLPKPKATKTTAGFRDLLAQMRGNHSMII